MAQEYNNLTGKKLQVNSAFRSPEEQANVNSGTNPKAAPGMSLHQMGRALDIQSGQVADLAANGLLSKFGFNQLAGDPPHISMANGGILSGPRSGYQPNLTMHGTEAVVPLPDGRSIPVAGGTESAGMMTAQLEKLDELISVMKSQLSVSNKLLSYSS
jgi:Flp pilus assembly secretin CpaC